MKFKLAVVLVILGVNCLNATQSYLNKSDNDTTNVNLTEIYYKDFKITEPEGLCEQNVCITKCCPFGAKYNANSKICVNSNKKFDYPIRDEYLRPQSANASDLFYFKIGIVQCEGLARFQMSAFTSKNNHEFYLRTDGNLYVESPRQIPPFMLVSPENYCIDNFVEEEDGKNISRVDALVCFVEDNDDPHNYVLTAVCMLVSCVFILVTVGVYLWLPKLHNVHGRVLTAYLVCLFVGFLLMATMQLMLHFEQATNVGCEVMTFMIYFSLLSAFFWLNVMCYDIWRVFSGKREIRPQKLVVWNQIRTYGIYAFGIPTILTALLIALEYSDLPIHPWLPNIRFQGCFISGYSKLLYLYGPILILCVANMALFVLTAVKIAMTRKETSVLSSRESSRSDQQNDKQTLFLYVKLFILMGISWILEVISALYPSKHWVYSDVYNVLIGLVIFIIFVCKQQILQLIKDRYKDVRRFPASQSRTWSRTTTTKDETTFNSKST